MAGGQANVIKNADGTTNYVDVHDHPHVELKDLPPLERKRTELAEFHCVLVDTQWLKSIGGLDPELMSVSEHWDMCMTARRSDRAVYVEPASQVHYRAPSIVNEDDIRWFSIRWSEEWTEKSIARLCQKYGLTPACPGLSSLRKFVQGHRNQPWNYLRKRYRNTFGRFLGDRVADVAFFFQKKKVQAALERDLETWQTKHMNS